MEWRGTAFHKHGIMVVVSRRRDEFLYFSRRGEARSEKSRTMKFCDARYAVRLLESARRKSSYRAPASSVVTSSRFSTNDSITPPAKRSSPLSSATLIFPSLTDKFATSARVYFLASLSLSRTYKKNIIIQLVFQARIILNSPLRMIMLMN